MYLSEICLHSLDHKKYKFSEDINIIACDNVEIFINIASVLDLFVKKQTSDSTYFSDHDFRIDNDFVFKSGEKTYVGNIYRRDGNMKKTKERPIFVTVIDKSNSTYYLEYNNNDFSLPNNFYKDCMSINTFQVVQKFFNNMFFAYYKGVIGNKVKNYDYIKFHCENVINIVNSFLRKNGYDDFTFSIFKNTFVFTKNGIVTENRGSMGKIIHTFMEMYYRCMIKNPTALENVTDENGILVMFDNFGERPSYGEKKWSYYNFLKSIFKNFQIITI